jgi:hypothetical protein
LFRSQFWNLPEIGKRQVAVCAGPALGRAFRGQDGSIFPLKVEQKQAGLLEGYQLFDIGEGGFRNFGRRTGGKNETVYLT